MAFLLVDRIIEIVPGTRARGRFAISDHLPEFSPCLVAEAVGQLAAWVAMAKSDFQSRPVAGLAGEVRFRQRAVPGTTLDLEVELENCDRDAVLYNGWARVEDGPIVELSRCVGPMLPMEEFDDPKMVRERFDLLCGTGAPPQNFSGNIAPSPLLVVFDHDPCKRLRAKMQVPSSAPFFVDHFPRKPVLPATLLLDAQVQLAIRLAAEALHPDVDRLLRPTRVYNMKMRSFVHPGQALEIDAEILTANRASVEIGLAAEIEGQRVSTCRLEAGFWGTS
jgi:3-hydroxymyristoyl/3-hydroxydecanoyl-(acyl carrier protein) dehydratase